ncbi:class I lanthipeptide [Pedobacter sp. MR2016-19]|uniref:class I lanthipeptide n=1 Tax=Pedobacter sp. MR2016-19 TaxID=2780089 RepID=UPI00187352D3|nr:class I lanthipeptide [Pedobacter sp. MR2016-19]MBE5322323.1 class I lanthipeptide [Pedobacter sp. MR2016-19]
MKSKQFDKNNKLSLDKKTIAKLDQSTLSSVNGGNEAGTTWETTTTTSLIPGTEWTMFTTFTTAY